MTNDLLMQVLESKKATCLLPLIEMVGDLDSLVSIGPERYSKEIPSKIHKAHKLLDDVDHILEDSFDSLDDSKLAKYARQRGEIRRGRRINKQEGAFLSRDIIPNLIDNLIQLIQEANSSISERESQVYLTRILEAPSCAKNVISRDNIKEVSKESNVKNDSIVSKEVNIILPVEEFVRYDMSDIVNSPRDSVNVVEAIDDIKSKISLDLDFDIKKLEVNWKESFNEKLNPLDKKTILMESYVAYYSNPSNSREKSVADFTVWNYIIPKRLIAENKYVA